MRHPLTQHRLGRFEFIALAACLMTLFALTIDMMLPALSTIGSDLGAIDENRSQFIVYTTIFGMGMGQLFYGPLSDVVGRKRSIYVGLSIFLIGSLIAIFTPSFSVMLIGRFLQGVGTAGARITVIALVRDLYSGAEMSQIMSFVITVLMIGPVVAPMLGQAIVEATHWRMIFVALFIFGVSVFVWFALRQVETLAPEKRQAFSWKPLAGAFSEAVRSRATIGYSIAAGITSGEIFGYISSSPQIYQLQYDVGTKFPLYLAASALAIAGASTVSALLVKRLGMTLVCMSALCGKLFVSSIYLVFVFISSFDPPLWTFILFVCLHFFFVGALLPNFTALALEPLGHIAGIASGIVGSITSILASFLGALIGQSYDGTILPLIVGMVALSFAATLMVVWTNSPRRAAVGPRMS